tara:strand:+ start:1481 stop:2851 length:1371 start_codon:yes stop_codon:yes gene_type:complete
MRIEQIRLKQFKLFDDMKIDTKPLTILTGANSSGKSSILNALAAVSQTEQPRIYPFEFVPNGTNCSLGSYKDIIHGHNTRKVFGVGFCAEHGKRHVCLNAEYRYSARGDQILLRSMEYKVSKDSLHLKWMGHKKGYTCHVSAQSLREMHDDKSYRQFVMALEQFAITEARKHLKKGDVKIKLPTKMFSVPSSKTSYRIPGRVSARDLQGKIQTNPIGNYLMANLQGFMSKFRKTVGYVGPVRAIPLRYYPPDQPHSTIDPSGANSAQLLHDWQKHDNKRFIEVGKLLEKLELTRNLRPESDTDDILKMIIQPFGHRETANLADVGFGVSQALPIVVADVALPDDSVLLVNQPEVHLHPTGQAQLANYFVERVKKRQYIVETHSEYLINRLRVLVQQGKVDPENVNIVFFASDKRTTSLVKKYDIRLQNDGSLKDAPKQFFQTYYTDSFALAMGGNK